MFSIVVNICFSDLRYTPGQSKSFVDTKLSFFSRILDSGHLNIAAQMEFKCFKYTYIENSDDFDVFISNVRRLILGIS